MRIGSGVLRWLSLLLVAACCHARAEEASPLLEVAAAHPAAPEAWQQRTAKAEAALRSIDAALARAQEPQVGVSSAGADVWTTPPEKLATGHDARGAMLAVLARREESIAAWQEALRLHPQFLRYWSDIGAELAILGRDREAEAAFAKALATRAPDAQSLQAAAAYHLAEARWSGVAELARGPWAAESQASDIGYVQLYGAIAARALDVDYASLAATAGSAWIDLLHGFAAGTTGEQELVAAMMRPNGSVDHGRLCEALYYAGAVREAEGDRAGAATYYRAALATDVRSFVEYHAAERALRRLRVERTGAG